MVRDYISLSTPRWEEFQEFQRLGLIPKHGDFSPAGVHYPPITNYPPLAPEEIYRSFHEVVPGEFDVQEIPLVLHHSWLVPNQDCRWPSNS